MPIRLDRPIRRVSRVIRLKSNLGKNDTDMMAWWYCGIYKNPAADSQPHALVAFREIGMNGLGDEVILRRIPLTTLGQVRIGSIWKDQKCHSEAVFEVAKFDVMISNNTWRVVSFNDALQHSNAPPYPFEIHPLQFERDKNWMIEFDLQSGGKLLIPCLEFFARCYGRSAELKRVLATYPWNGPEDIHNSRLYAPLDDPEEPGRWKVKLRRRMTNGDIVFLAHAKYHRYTESAAKSIYAQIETQHDPMGRIPAFIKVAPWFQGPTQLKVSGISFDNGRSFLALQVIGCSNPQGVAILRDRENSNLVNEAADPGASEAWAGTPERRLAKPPEIVDLTSDEEPDHSTGPIEVQDPDFEELGEPRLIIDRRRQKAASTAGPKRPGAGAEQYSSGEPSGDGKGVGYASIHAKPVLESQGTLRDVWNAMLFLQKRHPEKIRKVQWFTWDTGFTGDPEPKLIGLTEFDKDEDIETGIRNWLYADPAIEAVRGILVARLMLEDRWVCILEIQRRPRMKKDKDGERKPAEESFKGLVCIPPNMGQFKDWLTNTLSSIRYVKGIVQRLEGEHIENCAAFSHSRTKDEQVAGEAAVLNALEKVNVRL
ncbi:MULTISPECIES: hypothetical protein [Pseudomonas aeruginosa group]|uniref:hypothetical protein n=1 Tax=Pseudomonas aeruginosa group TaxID=136841 RepID=UPI00071B10A9|nr:MULTISPECIES: hypothetical protein [Pseudomonas aeruginosa group]KSC48276.1 hypothetical protein AO882_14480 [Pseudomonas paraeruginosa]KSL12001.1 hypothetical protein APA44_15940 [Pseudomonas aeruginosa]MBH8716852.1 hypothetical protein [Pseudomonas aeruginosa]MBH9343393.1 hypothetical protein [Pseudomonas aeruginosa]MBH9397884.1 hypothetical protein [Pseudomonas aeruginosa]